MDVNCILTHLVKKEICFPAIKLAWDTRFELQDLTKIPKIFPSDYIRELQLNTVERHGLLCHQQRKLEFWKPGFQIMVVPCLLVFQKYRSGENHSLNLNIRNISKETQKITLLMDESRAFEVDVNSNRIASFASGMTVTAKINFKPEHDKDYYHKLIISTKNSRFAVPILGIGKRGILDLPDQIDFKNVPVKQLKAITTIVNNIGTNSARFTLAVDGPFRVSPEKGVVAPKDTFNICISFISETIKSFQGYLLVKYENGEEVHTTLNANAVNEKVCLSAQKVTLEDTYVGFKSKDIVRITNDSDAIINFSWKNHASKSDFRHSIKRKINGRESIATFDQGGDTLEFVSYVNTVQAEPTFVHSIFAMEPCIGKIQSRHYTDIHIFFSPNAAESFLAEAFCDITGQEDRVSLQIDGRGLGPKYRFAFDELNVGTIFLGRGHSYEIPVENISQIKGAIIFERVSGYMTDVTTKVEPAKTELAPGQFGAFYFFLNCGGVPREYYEELHFRVPMTNELMYINVKGNIAFPGMHFSVLKLMFGDVSYGFPKTEQVVLVNDSLNPVDITLKFDDDGDGTESALNYEKIIESFVLDEFSPPLKPREFNIEPSSFQLAPRGFQRLNITLLANNYGDYNRKIFAYVVDNNEPIQNLSISAHCPVPVLINSRTEIFLKDCYVGFPYSEMFEIYNPTDLSGVYCIVPVPSSRVIFQSKEFVGILKPRNLTTIHFEISCLSPGETKAIVEVYLVGKNEGVLELTVKCIGIPSKLEVSVKEIDFGTVNVLDTSQEEFELINESPLVVPYSTALVEGGNAGDHWVVQPAAGSLEPHTRRTLIVDLTLQEAGPHSAVLRIEIPKTNTFIDVTVKGVGAGCSLRFKPAFSKTPTVDFGTLFTDTEKSFTYEITNLGFVSKMLDWKHAEDDPPLNNVPTTKSKYKNKSIEKLKRKSIFEIDPSKRLLGPAETMHVVFTARSGLAKSTDEDYMLWTYKPRQGSSESNIKHLNKLSVRSVDLNKLQSWHQTYKPVPVTTVKFLAVFEAPRLKFSKKSMLFKIDASPMEQTFEEQGTIKIENCGLLSIAAIFHTTFPFSIVMKGVEEEHGTNDWSYTFKPHESLYLTINFDGRHLRKDKGSIYFQSNLDAYYEGHSDAENIPLRGEVHFPSIGFDRDVIDFGIVANGTESVEEFYLTNTCSFCLTYKWYIKPFSTMIRDSRDLMVKNEPKAPSSITGKVETKSVNDVSDSASGIKEVDSKTNEIGSVAKEVDSKLLVSSPGASGDTPVEVQNNEEIMEVDVIPSVYTAIEMEIPKVKEVFVISKSSHSLDNYGQSIQYMREKLYRSRMMEMVGLQDLEKEVEDELLYLQENRQEPSMVADIALSELIDIVPMAGVIQAGQSQKFTVVFYGHPDIQFKMVAICFVEGGSSKYLTIMGHSTSRIPKPIVKPSIKRNRMSSTGIITGLDFDDQSALKETEAQSNNAIQEAGGLSGQARLLAADHSQHSTSHKGSGATDIVQAKTSNPAITPGTKLSNQALKAGNGKRKSVTQTQPNNHNDDVQRKFSQIEDDGEEEDSATKGEAWTAFLNTENGSALAENLRISEDALRVSTSEHNEVIGKVSILLSRSDEFQSDMDIFQQNRHSSEDESDTIIGLKGKKGILRDLRVLQYNREDLKERLINLRLKLNDQKRFVEAMKSKGSRRAHKFNQNELELLENLKMQIVVQKQIVEVGKRECDAAFETFCSERYAMALRKNEDETNQFNELTRLAKTQAKQFLHQFYQKKPPWNPY